MAFFRRILAVCALVALGTFAEAAAASGDARTSGDIGIGTQLVATSDVTLQRAGISKGSKVNVTKLLMRAGHLDGVHLELADGNVVKVGMELVRSFFRVAE